MMVGENESLGHEPRRISERGRVVDGHRWARVEGVAGARNAHYHALMQYERAQRPQVFEPRGARQIVTSR
ncbi:hypothetical protein ACMHYB_03395 [Sorangium sp. So ce1128]